MKKLIAIVGPTGIGKTAFAVQLGRLIPVDLVNVDSIQVYKGLDIISGKDIGINTSYIPEGIPKKPPYTFQAFDIEGLPIFLLDLVDATYSFNSHDFVLCANTIIPFICSRGNTPLLVGGTGLYLKALENGIDVDVPPNKELRRELAGKEARELFEILLRKDFHLANRLNNSERNNSQRLIRRIEIAEFRGGKSRKEHTRYEFLKIGLRTDRENLKKRIDRRVEARIKEGAFDEAQKIFRSFSVLSPQVKTANGYRQLFEYLRGNISREEAIQKWKFSEYRHAKSQMTWFEADKNILWIEGEEVDIKQKALSHAQSFLQGKS